MTKISIACLNCTLLILASLLKAAPGNILLILSDDHRYDFMSFMEESPEFLETPNLDRIAKEGAHLANAFVTTSLCSCLLYTSPSPRDATLSRMPSSA